MAFEAILTLKERSGSSVQAIKKCIVTKYPDLAFAPHQLRSALKKGTSAEKFIKVRYNDGRYCCLLLRQTKEAPAHVARGVA